MLKILHVASFSGNVGDNANHAGSYRMLSRALGQPFTVTEWEIRNYFWRKMSFDAKFATLCNEHDFILFGGGNYFELWVERSTSGTSVDIPFDVLEKIQVPIVFHSLGFDAGQGYSEEGLAKTKRYFEVLLSRSDTFISLRNDGSTATARKLLGPEIVDHLHLFPDGGFFASEPGALPERDAEKVVVAVNIAGDMLERRFGSELSIAGFYNDFANFIECVTEEKKLVYFKFFPHIYRDFQPITEILNCLDDSVRRCRVEVAPLNTGSNSAEKLLKDYAKCCLVLGNRFHANVCPIGMKIPTVGLVNYPQVQFLYEELGLQDRFLDITQANAMIQLEQLVKDSLNSLLPLKERYSQIADQTYETAEKAYAHLAAWLKRRIKP